MKKVDYFKELKTWFENDPGLYIGGLSEKEIADSEENIGLYFSPSYKVFLRQYGAGLIDAYYIHGKPSDNFMGGYLKSVDEKTFFYRSQKWPSIEDWYVISDDGRGNPIGCKPDGSVWLSDHDAGFEQVKLASSFEEFLHKLLTDTLYE